jgi:phospholipase C
MRVRNSSLMLCLVLTMSAFAGTIPQSKHVWIITEENHSYEKVIGNPNMPYYNSLARKHAVAAQFYAKLHNSLTDLFHVTAGQNVTLWDKTTACFDVDNIVRRLLLHGMTWKSYQEDLPYAGFMGLGWAGYVRRHNPLSYFSDTCAPSQKYNSVPFSQFAKDIANNSTPNYAFISPNIYHDAHDGSLAAADKWLSQQVPKILARPEFQSGGDGLLFIIWDEGTLYTDNRCSAWDSTGCGGRVAILVIGPKVKRGFKSQMLYHHRSLLRTVCDAFRFTSCPGGAGSAPSMSDFF